MGRSKADQRKIDKKEKARESRNCVRMAAEEALSRAAGQVSVLYSCSRGELKL